MHSHHGSCNGFNTDFPNIGSCEYDAVTYKYDFLSTRDGAYSTIVCDELEKHSQYGNYYSTDGNTIKYYKIDVLTDKIDSIDN